MIGWKAGHRAARVCGITLAHFFDAAFEIEQLAATEARVFMEDRMERHNLTWREGVHLFFSYFDGYKDGALLQVTVQAERITRRPKEAV